jgi:hypothetical protein
MRPPYMPIDIVLVVGSAAGADDVTAAIRRHGLRTDHDVADFVRGCLLLTGQLDDADIEDGGR